MTTPYDNSSSMLTTYQSISLKQHLDNHFLSTVTLLQKNAPVLLTQEDFSTGTVHLSTSGYYKLEEDIVFDFPDVDFSILDKSFILGNYAGISIHGKNIILDGNNKTIRMSEAFWRKQRFFALIQLNNGPFANSQGPVDFGEGIPFSDTVIIKNLNMGLTSHHAVLGNQAMNILFDNINIRDFEVAGISLNGCDFIKYKDVEVHHNLLEVPFSARLSQSIFLLRLFDTLPTVSPTLQSEADTLRALVDTQLSMDITQALGAFENHNVDKRPDCGTFYGINTHAKGVSVNGFDSSTNAKLTFINLQNVHIHNLTSAPAESKGIRYVTPESVLEEKPLTDVQGSIYPPNIETILTDIMHPEYPIWKFSLSLSELGTLGRPYIKPRPWNIGTGPDSYRLHRHADVMNHLIKGLIGLSIGSFKYGCINNISIHDLINDGEWEGISKGHVIHPAGSNQSFMGMWVNGIVLSNTNYDLNKSKTITINNLKSLLGPEFKCRKINELYTKFTLFV